MTFLLTGGQRSANMSAMTTLSEALPPVADGEMRYTPWDQIDVRSPLLNVHRVLLPPEGAREWLKHNLVNRDINQADLRALRRAIRNGQLLTSQDMPSFCAASGVITGAHRMTACVLENTPVPMLVMVGADEGLRWVADTHSKRTITQNFKLMGFANPRVLGSLATAVWRLEEFGEIRKTGGAKESAQLPELQRLVRAYPQVERFAEIAWQTYVGLKRKETPTVLGLALWMMARGDSDPGAAIEFMRQLAFEPLAKPLAVATEEDEPATPAALLRRRLVSPGYERGGRTDLTRVTQIIEAWNAWVTGDPEWVPPHLEQAASVPKPLHPGNEYPALLREALPDARTWQSTAA